jgi:hypothetical protein
LDFSFGFHQDKIFHQSSQNALFFWTMNGLFVTGPGAAAAVGLRHAPASAVFSLAREKKLGGQFAPAIANGKADQNFCKK